MSRKPSSRASPSATSSRGFDKELAEIEALSESLKAGAPLDASTTEHLRKSLTHRNNFIVAKAAKLVAESLIAALLPDALAAYDRFFIDAETADPQCWAKNALVKTLVALEHRQKDAYLRGLRHHQLEPTWGGATDTAGTLRGACAHALVNCPGLTDQELLTLLLELFADADKGVRVEAARAVGNVGGPSAVLLLRLRALLGQGEEPEVLGACFTALLDLEGARAISFVAGNLEEGDDLAAEAAFALSEQRSSEALAVLIARYRHGVDTWFGSVLLSAIALTRLPEAIDFLVAFIASDAREAPAAIEAIGRSSPPEEWRVRVQAAVEQAGSQRLLQAFRQHMPPPPSHD
jgi:HEAT repeat protein